MNSPGATRRVAGEVVMHRRPEVSTLDISSLTRGPTLGGTSRDHCRRVAPAARTIGRFEAEGVAVGVEALTRTEERAPVPFGIVAPETLSLKGPVTVTRHNVRRRRAGPARRPTTTRRTGGRTEAEA